MKSKETIQILSEIANSLDNYSLYKEATTVTRLMTKIAQAETNESEGEDTLAKYDDQNPMPKADREAYYKKTGQELTITEEEFYDMMRTQIQNEVKELQMLLGLLALMVLTKLAAPDDDEDDLTKNRYKWVAKLVNKASDELSFYYIPTSFESISKGSLIPAVGILSRVKKVVEQVAKETYGRSVSDQDIIDKTYPLKYFMDVIPVASQFNKEVLPFIDPELAKEMGIRVSPEARQGQ